MRRSVSLVILVVLSLSIFTFLQVSASDVTTPATPYSEKDVAERIHSVGGYFTENRGQVTNDQVRFYYSGGMQAGFAEGAVLIELVVQDQSRPLDVFEERMRGPHVQRDDPPSVRGVMARITFPGSNKVMPQGVQEMPHRSNYFIGNDPSKWRTGVRSYREIVYSDLYDGIDLVYRTQDGQLKYEFIVDPGADPAVITVSYEGIDSLRLEQSGELAVSTVVGELREGKPISYQDKKQVRCAFVQRGPLSFGFGCEGSDPSRLLVIDPLVYSTFLGGGHFDFGFGIAVDPSGSAYVTGETWSTDFPSTPGSFETTLNGGDAFVAKLNATGSALDYATFLGGSGDDYGFGIAVDSSGNAFVTGLTRSTDFPTTPGSFDTSRSGDDAFVAKLNSTGSVLDYATFLGGSSPEIGFSIAVDSSGSAYVTGLTDSRDFPTTPGSFDTTYGGYTYNVFVTKLEAAGTSLDYSTFLGGSSDSSYSYGRGIAVDSSGNAFVTGLTHSAAFPSTPGSFDTTFNGSGDAFAVKLNSTGSALDYATFLGGSGYDEGYGIAVDSSGSAYVTGSASSTDLPVTDFPVTPGAFDTTFGGGDYSNDAFVVKLDATGGALAFGTFLGGDGRDWGYGIAVDSSDSAYVTGKTWSTDFPSTPGSFDTTYNGGDAFVAKLNAAGSVLDYGTFLGGSGDDVGYGIAVDSSGSAYVAGSTGSRDFPTTPGSFDTTFNGAGLYRCDAFVTKLEIGSSANTPPEILSFAASPSPSFEGDAVLFAVNAADADGDTLTYDFDFESDGMFDFSGSSSTAMHFYGDDFDGTTMVRVSDGKLFTEATTAVVVRNLPPSVRAEFAANVTGDLTLRVAGEKWHDVNMILYDDGVAIANASVTRFPGSPDDQAATIEDVTIDLFDGDLSAIVKYTPEDDPINGQLWGATPAWLVFTSKDGSGSSLHHTFNVRHEDTWTWIVHDLRALLAGVNLTFTAAATDPGSDDLTFVWKWGYGTPATATTYYNDGLGPDPYPSPNGTLPFTATDVQVHAFITATHSITLQVLDDDGGSATLTLSLLVRPVRSALADSDIGDIHLLIRKEAHMPGSEPPQARDRPPLDPSPPSGS